MREAGVEEKQHPPQCYPGRARTRQSEPCRALLQLEQGEEKRAYSGTAPLPSWPPSTPLLLLSVSAVGVLRHTVSRAADITTKTGKEDAVPRAHLRVHELIG